MSSFVITILAKTLSGIDIHLRGVNFTTMTYIIRLWIFRVRPNGEPFSLIQVETRYAAKEVTHKHPFTMAVLARIDTHKKLSVPGAACQTFHVNGISCAVTLAPS